MNKGRLTFVFVGVALINFTAALWFFPDRQDSPPSKRGTQKRVVLVPQAARGDPGASRENRPPQTVDNQPVDSRAGDKVMLKLLKNLQKQSPLKASLGIVLARIDAEQKVRTFYGDKLMELEADPARRKDVFKILTERELTLGDVMASAATTGASAPTVEMLDFARMAFAEENQKLKQVMGEANFNAIEDFRHTQIAEYFFARNLAERISASGPQFSADQRFALMQLVSMPTNADLDDRANFETLRVRLREHLPDEQAAAAEAFFKREMELNERALRLMAFRNASGN